MSVIFHVTGPQYIQLSDFDCCNAPMVEL